MRGGGGSRHHRKKSPIHTVGRAAVGPWSIIVSTSLVASAPCLPHAAWIQYRRSLVSTEVNY